MPKWHGLTIHTYIHIYIHTHTHTHIHTYILLHITSIPFHPSFYLMDQYTEAHCSEHNIAMALHRCACLSNNLMVVYIANGKNWKTKL